MSLVNGPRLIKVEDAPALASLHRRCFLTGGWSEAQLLGSLNLPTTTGWAAYDGATPAGFILCQVLEDQAEILTLCVAQSHRRQGLGGMILSHALVQLQGKTGALWLEVAEDNRSALRLYDSKGFQATGRRKDYYKRPDRAVDAVLMSYSFGF